MANDLTGDFDVVAEFSLPAANRLLAAMHAIKRVPHSVALRVDDIPRPGPVRPSVFELVDAVGDTIVNPARIRLPELPAGQTPGTHVMYSLLGGIVNTDVVDIFVPPPVPSQLQGRAQLQFAPPTLELADPAASRVTVRMRVKARYLADPGTPPASEFAKGDIVLTTAVNQIVSQAGAVVGIDLRSHAVRAAFVPTWTSRPLSTEDRAGIDLLIGNALKSSVLPSNTTLPPGIQSMKFKALAGTPQAIAVLLKTTAAAANPATVHRVFLGNDDFAFGVGDQMIKAALQPTIDKILTTPVPTVTIRIPLVVSSATATYTITLNSAVVDLQAGRILLTIKGRATAPQWFAPNFDFTAKQAFSLLPSGSTADLVVGDLSLDTSSWLVDRFRTRAQSTMAQARDRALAQSDVRASVRRMLDAEGNLGGFLRSLLTPARPDGQPQSQPLGFSLTYSSADISPPGIVLRGTLAVADWPPAHVEFEEIRTSGSGPFGAVPPAGPEYSGFKSWIAGGVVESYEWKRAGQPPPGFRDDNRFVRLPEGPVIFGGDEPPDASPRGPLFGYEPMCLTIRGSRLSAAGPVVPQPVTASYCAFQWFPLLDAAVVGGGATPLVALARPGPDGRVDIVGHAPAVRADIGRTSPNLIVHFGDAESAGRLDAVRHALRKSGRADAATAIVAVLESDQMAHARYVPGVVYAEQQGDDWPRAWGIGVVRRPATFVISPTGEITWQYEGEADATGLSDALRRVLVARSAPSVTTVTAGVRIGHAPPNFLFAPAAGSELTLHKLVGRPVVLVFWRSTSRPSVDAVLALGADPGWKGALVLAINDGESGEAATQTASDARFAATVVPDPSQSISRAYGISGWPTTVLIDALGVVREVRQGQGFADRPADVRQETDGVAGQ